MLPDAGYGRRNPGPRLSRSGAHRRSTTFGTAGPQDKTSPSSRSRRSPMCRYKQEPLLACPFPRLDHATSLFSLESKKIPPILKQSGPHQNAFPAPGSMIRSMMFKKPPCMSREGRRPFQVSLRNGRDLQVLYRASLEVRGAKSARGRGLQNGRYQNSRVSKRSGDTDRRPGTAPVPKSPVCG
jgi:hypothetical protein